MAMNPSTSGDGAGRAATGNRPIAGLLSDLWRETTTLVHDEMELAKVELTQRVSDAGRGAGAVAIGGAIVFAGVLVLLGAAVAALMMMLPPQVAPWLSPLIVGAVVCLIGAIALRSGRQRLQARNLAPQRTLESLRQDRQLAREHLQ
jgi:hypothetical protein